MGDPVLVDSIKEVYSRIRDPRSDVIHDARLPTGRLRVYVGLQRCCLLAPSACCPVDLSMTAARSATALCPLHDLHTENRERFLRVMCGCRHITYPQGSSMCNEISGHSTSLTWFQATGLMKENEGIV